MLSLKRKHGPRVQVFGVTQILFHRGSGGNVRDWSFRLRHNRTVELSTNDRRLPEVERKVPKGFRVAGLRPERPLANIADCVRCALVTGHWPAKRSERLLSDFLSGSNRHTAEVKIELRMMGITATADIHYLISELVLSARIGQ